MIIPVFFSDFQRFVSSERFKGEMEHPVFYYEDDLSLSFYKPVGSFIYSSVLDKLLLPEGIVLKDVKTNLNAIELPAPLNTGRYIKTEGYIS